MKCRKCGAEMLDNDVYCGNCGSKLVDDSQAAKPAIEMEPEGNKGEVRKKSKKKKVIKIIVGVVIVVFAALAILAYMGSQPRDINMEAGELGKILYTDEEEQYYEDNMHIHGYFIRNTNADGKEDYCLVDNVDDLENSEGVIFTFDEGVNPELGNGSELIVNGKIGSIKDAPSTRVLMAESIEVVKKEERTYIFDSVAELLDVKKKYVDKKVSVYGIVDRASFETIYIEDELEDVSKGKYILLKDLDGKSEAYMPVGYYVVEGTLKNSKGNIAINVDDMELILEIEIPEEPVVENVVEFDSPKELIDSYEQYDGRKVAVTGWVEAAGDSGYLMGGESPIELTNLTSQEISDLYGGYTKFTGRFTYNNGIFYLNVEKIGD